MITINVRLPDSLHRMAKEIAIQDHISLNQFITSVVAEKISAITTESFLDERAGRGSQDKFRQALAKVPDVEPEIFERKRLPLLGEDDVY